MRRHGWLIGFVAAWIISVVDDHAIFDIMAPFAIGSIAFSTHRVTVAALWALEALQNPALMVLRIIMSGIVYIMAVYSKKRFICSAAGLSFLYALLSYNSLPISILMAFMTSAILVSGSQKLVSSPPSSISPIQPEGSPAVVESYSHRPRTRTTRPGSCRQRTQGSGHHAYGIVEAGSTSRS